VILGYVVVLAGMLVAHHGLNSWPQTAVDFPAVWAGGYQALHGGAVSAFGASALADIQAATVGTLEGYEPFAYPPHFLLVAIPLGMLPYVTAFLVWQALTLTPFAGAIWLIVPRWEAMIWAVAFPAVFWNVIDGQERAAVRRAAGRGARIAGSPSCHRRNPVRASHLPAAARAAGPAGADGDRAPARLRLGSGHHCGLAAVSLVLFGYAAWAAFIAFVPEQFRLVLLGSGASDNWTKLQSVYCLVRRLGGDRALAWQVHNAVSGCFAAGRRGGSQSVLLFL